MKKAHSASASVMKKEKLVAPEIRVGVAVLEVTALIEKGDRGVAHHLEKKGASQDLVAF